MSTPVLFVNIGTPKTPKPEDVGVYLKEFLSDPDVITLPNPLRWMLVNWLIVPRRKHQSAKLYKKIWTKNGSPLKTYSDSLVSKINRSLPTDFKAHSVMRYGDESLEVFWPKLKDEESLIVLPAFPQYAMATSKSVQAQCEMLKKKHGFPKRIKYLDEFYQQPFFFNAVAEKIKPHLENVDHLLFSYHGLPKSHMNSPLCYSEGCCQNLEQAKGKCYRAQCFHTTRLVVEALKLDQSKYSVSFQSRLGRSEWIKPYSIDQIKQLAAQGVQRLAVVCPAFVVDCLETLEEVGIGLKEEFVAAGGESLTLIPCLNDDDLWAQQLAEHISR